MEGMLVCSVYDEVGVALPTLAPTNRAWEMWSPVAGLAGAWPTTHTNTRRGDTIQQFCLR